MSQIPAIAHYMERYLGLTGAFIHDYLAALGRVRTVVIAERFENLDRFPLPPPATFHRAAPRRGSPLWAMQAVTRSLRGGEPHIERLLTREEVRLVHVHFGQAAFRLLEVRRRTRLPLVTSFYGCDDSMKQVNTACRNLYRRLFDLGDAFLVEGPAMRARLESIGCPASRLRVQRIAIDPARYRFAAREDPGRGAVRLLLRGRMVPRKGHDLAIEALAEAARSDPRLQLRLVGDGPGRAQLERLIRQHRLEDRVTLLGSLTGERLVAEMEGAHIYVQPSRTAGDGDSEGGAPTALLEAQACGLPILATRHADIPFVVREGDSALLSDENDAGTLAENMLLLAGSPQRWGPMGRAGRAHVEEHHDVSRLATQREVFYATLAETGRLS